MTDISKDELNSSRGKMMFMFRDDVDILRKLPKEDRARFYLALESWFCGEEVTDLSPFEMCFFESICNKALNSLAKSKQNALNGKRGGRPKTEEKRTKATESELKRLEANETELKRIKANESEINRTKANESEENRMKPTESPKYKDKDKDKDEEKYIFEKKGDLQSPQKKTVFIKPTLDQCKAYAVEAHLNINTEHFYDHFQSNGWRVGGKAPMKDWKASMRNWARNNFSQPNTTQNVDNSIGYDPNYIPETYNFSLNPETKK